MVTHERPGESGTGQHKDHCLRVTQGLTDQKEFGPGLIEQDEAVWAPSDAVCELTLLTTELFQQVAACERNP